MNTSDSKKRVLISLNSKTSRLSLPGDTRSSCITADTSNSRLCHQIAKGMSVATGTGGRVAGHGFGGWRFLNSGLISGASIAGPAMAYWLAQYSFDVTIVERAPSLRKGGYAVDI